MRIGESVAVFFPRLACIAIIELQVAFNDEEKMCTARSPLKSDAGIRISPHVSVGDRLNISE